MSLREKLREGLYDAEHKPRLAYARSYFLEYGNGDPDLKGLEEFYLEWRNFDEYIVLQKQIDNLRIKGEIEKETIAVKCAKSARAWWRVRRRLRSLHKLENHTLFDIRGNAKCSNVLFATLTYDIRRSNVQEAWETVGEEFNKWIRNLRKKFGRISYLRCWEASRKGYPHVHLLIFFPDHNVRVFRMKGKYRIKEKQAFKTSWHSFVDVQAVRKVKKGIKYITKYLSKTRSDYAVQSQTLTLALCWLFKNRSFALCGNLKDVIYIITNIQLRLIQSDLLGNEIKLKTEWIFIGIFSASKLGIDHNEWRKIITDRRIFSKIMSS